MTRIILNNLLERDAINYLRRLQDGLDIVPDVWLDLPALSDRFFVIAILRRLYRTDFDLLYFDKGHYLGILVNRCRCIGFFRLVGLSVYFRPGITASQHLINDKLNLIEI